MNRQWLKGQEAAGTLDLIALQSATHQHVTVKSTCRAGLLSLFIASLGRLLLGFIDCHWFIL